MSDSKAQASWRRVLANISVTYVWAYDTSAILDDYYDSEAGVLPAGQLIKFSAVSEDPDHLLCDLDDPKMVELTQLPRGRVMRFRPWCFATRLQAVVAAADYERLTIKTERASWMRRLLRSMMHLS